MSIVEGLIRPDFIVIGAMKSGTTTLYRMLSAHPDIAMSRDKEPDYFIDEKNFGRGDAWYSDQFQPGFAIYGEASPNYTKADDFAGVPERIKARCPDVKLIYVVRDPVERFISQYKHSWTIGDVFATPDDLPATHEYRHILRVSSYARQLGEYLLYFDLRDILIVDFDQLAAEPEAVFSDVLAFIGAAPIELANAGVHNDNAEISRVPASLLRFAQSPLGRSFTRLVGRENRDRVRRLLARGKPRQAPDFPEVLIERIRTDVRDDAARFRQVTGMSFPGWTV